jgi:hypothetical protein
MIQEKQWKNLQDPRLLQQKRLQPAAAAEAVKAAAAAAAEVVKAAAVAATAVATAVEAAAVIAAAVLQPPPPVVYSRYTRPTLLTKFDKDAFKVNDKNGKQKSEAAARMGKNRAVNVIVNIILGDYFSPRYTPEQLVLALHEASKHPRVRMLFKSAGLTDIKDLEAM